MTANVLPQQVRSFKEAGLDDHLGKPIRRAELFHKLNIWLERVDGKPEPTSSRERAEIAAFQELYQLMGRDRVTSGLTKLRQQIDDAFDDAFTDEASAIADRAQLARRAHALVSHTAVLGFLELSRLCSDLEEACTGDSDTSVTFRKAKAAAHIADRSASETLGAATGIDSFSA